MMDSGNEIPVHVLRFLEANIDTVPQLETLLMMSEVPDRNWLITDVASRNYIPEQRAWETMNALLRRGLVAQAMGAAGEHHRPGPRVPEDP